MQSSQGNAPPPVPPRRPPRALSPSQARTTTASSSSGSSSTSMLRNRALARVNRIAAATGDYVAPRLESAAVSASTKLAHWRDRDREQQAQASNYSTATGADAGGYAYQVRQPKRAAATATTASSSSRAVNPGTSDWYNEQPVSPPYTRSMTTSSTAPSEAASSTSASTAGSSSRKWTASGLGSYLNLSSYSAFGGGASATADSDSMAATGGTKGKGKATAVGTDDIDEDKVLCFPGWATLEPSPHHDASEPALVLSIHAHGYAYRQRPLSQASRSQRIFYALAKSFAALPKIPPATAAAAAIAAGSTPATAAAIEAEEEVRDLEDKVQGLGIREEEAARDKEGQGEEAIEKLLAVGGRAGDRLAEAELEHEAVAVTRGDSDGIRQTFGEPDEMTLEERAQSPTARDFAAASKSSSSSTRSSTKTRSQTSPAVSTSSRSAAPSPEESPILSTPAKLSRRPGFRIEIPSSTAAALKRAGNSTSQPGSPGGSGTASPVRSPGLKSAAFNFVKRGGDKNKAGSGSATSSRASSRATSPVRNNGRTRETPARSSTASTITSTSASASASTGAAALPPETWPAPFTLPSDPAALPRLHTNLHTRLLPFFGAKLANRKVRLSVLPALGEGQLYDGVLATKVVRTHATSGGGFRTRLEVKGPELKKWLELVGARGSGQGSAHDNGAGSGVEALRVRVVAELLEPEAVLPSVVDTAPSFGAGAGGASLGATAAADKYATATAVDEIELDVAIQGDGGEGGGVRIVSDVDDTIKWTEVTKGTKTIFRNVFVRELPEIRVPGMATWYRQLQAQGAQFHYVSNSPVELWPVLRTFLKLSGFPNGSCTLKEYGGASSAIAKLWEEPGQRKKANVENILKEFPAARFILVGDSGEQDLELYVALARQYPANILAIYIRDVTTPFDPIAADPARRHSRERERARAAAAAAEPAQDGHPRRAGTDQPAPSHESSKRLSREASLPPEITWKHRNSIHDLAGLIDDDALRFAAPEAFSPTTSQRPSIEVERTTLSDMPDLPGQWDGPHERPVPPRRSSDTELDQHASRMPPSTSDARAVPDTPTSPYTSSPAPLDSPSLMSEPDSDPLSPNNPIRPAPAGTAQDAAVEAFYRRVAAAEKGLPKGIILRLFRHGNECAEEALELVKTAGKRPFGA